MKDKKIFEAKEGDFICVKRDVVKVGTIFFQDYFPGNEYRVPYIDLEFLDQDGICRRYRSRLDGGCMYHKEEVKTSEYHNEIIKKRENELEIKLFDVNSFIGLDEIMIAYGFDSICNHDDYDVSKIKKKKQVLYDCQTDDRIVKIFFDIESDTEEEDSEEFFEIKIKEVLFNQYLTKVQAIKKHRHMWNWIADETERTGTIIVKDDYFIAMGITYSYDIPAYDCYCCEYDKQQNGGEFVGRCKYCPLDWDSKCGRFMCCDKERVGDDKGLFARWKNALNIEESVKLARKIANLKVK